MTKSEKIVQKLQAGLTAKEIIRQGFKHGLVYKLNRQYRSGISQRPGSINETFIQHPLKIANLSANDTEIQSDNTQVDLTASLAQIDASTLMESRIAALEQKLAELEQEIQNQLESLIDLQTILNHPLLSDLLKKHNCACGANDFLAIKVQCRKCGKEKRIVGPAY